jgi:hypothetical protein
VKDPLVGVVLDEGDDREVLQGNAGTLRIRSVPTSSARLSPTGRLHNRELTITASRNKAATATALGYHEEAGSTRQLRGIVVRNRAWVRLQLGSW